MLVPSITQTHKARDKTLGIKDVSSSFRIEVVKHRKFSYRGVVLGWDIRPWATRLLLPPDGKVLCLRPALIIFYASFRMSKMSSSFEARSFRSSFYVAEENLQLVPLDWEVEKGGEIDILNSRRPHAQNDRRSDLDSALDELQASRTIQHRFMSLYFNNYHTRTGRYISPHRRHFQFPDREVEVDIGVISDQGDSQVALERKLEETRMSHLAERESKQYYNPYEPRADASPGMMMMVMMMMMSMAMMMMMMMSIAMRTKQVGVRLRQFQSDLVISRHL